jgi:hypothetical protein
MRTYDLGHAAGGNAELGGDLGERFAGSDQGKDVGEAGLPRRAVFAGHLRSLSNPVGLIEKGLLDGMAYLASKGDQKSRGL